MVNCCRKSSIYYKTVKDLGNEGFVSLKHLLWNFHNNNSHKNVNIPYATL